VRQLIAAPAWLLAGVALFAFGGVPGAAGITFVATLFLALAGWAALPGAAATPGVRFLPRGGDRAEPVAVVRALSGLAHYAWIAVGATLPFVARMGEGEAIVPALGASGVALVGFLAVRVLLVRLVPGRTIGGAF
jgi:hypothetical protein